LLDGTTNSDCDRNSIARHVLQTCFYCSSVFTSVHRRYSEHKNRFVERTWPTFKSHTTLVRQKNRSKNQAESTISDVLMTSNRIRIVQQHLIFILHSNKTFYTVILVDSHVLPTHYVEAPYRPGCMARLFTTNLDFSRSVCFRTASYKLWKFQEVSGRQGQCFRMDFRLFRMVQNGFQDV